MKKVNEKKGFTLAELLIVVAIIAVLVAIAIPIFTAQLEKSREATDEANIRAAYAEVTAAQIGGESASKWTKSVKAKQTKSGWTTSPDFPANINSGGSVVAKTSGNSWTVKIDADGKVTVN